MREWSRDWAWTARSPGRSFTRRGCVLGYPEVREVTRREALAWALVSDEPPVRSAGGRAVLGAWRDRDPGGGFEGWDDSVDMLHRCPRGVGPDGGGVRGPLGDLRAGVGSFRGGESRGRRP